MSQQVMSGGRGWVRARLARHLQEMARLSGPAILSRIGMVTLGLVDTAMVGRYATTELAQLSLANGSVLMVPLVLGLGLMLGVLTHTASAFGNDDLRECGRVWRRSQPLALGSGLVLMAVCLPAEFWLRLLGQQPDVIEPTAHLVRLLALGLPAHMLFASATFMLEGIKRPAIAMWTMVAANLVNVAMNYVLIFGAFGMPELGAEGAAITSTVVRTVMAVLCVGYIWYAPSMRPFAVRQPHGQRWRDWASQRAMGYGSALSLGAEVAAFAALTVIAGWMGTLPVAAHGIAMTVLSLPFMLAAGIGSATGVRVGVAFGRGDRPDAALAGWTGLLVGAVALTIAGVFILALPDRIFDQFSNDARLLPIALPLIAFTAYVLLFDGGQNIMSMALRGLGDVWWPTAIQTMAYFAVMIPLAVVLSGASPGNPLSYPQMVTASGVGGGPLALFIATFWASVFSVGALGLRFVWLTSGRRG